MAKQAKNTGRHWYVIHTYSGYEDAVREALMQRIESMNMQDKIFDVIVPKETQIVVKKGKPKTEKKRLFPGYVLVDMMVDDELVRGSKHSKCDWIRRLWNHSSSCFC
jgi:transcription termination/antitermination protein NusG